MTLHLYLGMLRSGRRTLASRLLSAPCPKENTEQFHGEQVQVQCGGLNPRTVHPPLPFSVFLFHAEDQVGASATSTYLLVSDLLR